MNDSVVLKKSVETLIDDVEQQWPSCNLDLPEDINVEISIRPEWAIDLIKSLKNCDESEPERTDILFRLLDESLRHIRYSIDRNDDKGLLILKKVEKAVNQVIHVLPQNLIIELNQIIFESKLTIDVSLDVSKNKNAEDGHPVDIVPQLPDLLERLRREKVFKDAFELYELMLPQIQLMPAKAQLSIIAELAHSKKAIAHEVAILMLLHPKPEIRKQVADFLYKLSDDSVFTCTDLRRMILIRNWIPQNERANLDKLISHLRKNNLSPASYHKTKSTRLFGSSMDGAGAAGIMVEVKKNNQHQIAGFIVKIGIGIRDPWVMQKAPKRYIDDVIVEKSKTSDISIEPVSTKFVDKIVQHFLSESLKSKEVPDPILIQIAEMLGADNWQPQPLSWSDEINKLREQYTGNLNDLFFKESLQRSGTWHSSQSTIAAHWFESGEFAENFLLEAVQKHKECQNSSISLEAIATECLMDSCLDKWKTIMLITCLWMRTKKVHGDCKDLFAILHCLDNKMAPSSIPLICNITAQTMATVHRREMFG